MVENHKMIVENSGLLTVAALKHLNVEKENSFYIKRWKYGRDHYVFYRSAWPRSRETGSSLYLFSFPDKPGELAKVAELLAKEHGNIIKLEHNQFISINRNAADRASYHHGSIWYRPQNQIVTALTDADIVQNL